jgi:uncharacterized phiE125 gp8 family phage protein
MITLAEAKQHLRITNTDHDTRLNALILSVTKWIENYTRRTITEVEAFEEVFDGFPDVIVLSKVPVQEVNSIVYLDGNDAEQTLASSAYVVDGRELKTEISPAYATVWPTTTAKPQSVTVTYKIGYAESPGAPADLKQAALILLGHLDRNTGDDEKSIEMPSAVRALLGHYIVPRDY